MALLLVIFLRKLKMIKNLRVKLSNLIILTYVFFTQHVLAANSTISLDGPSSGPLAKVTKLMQELVDFLGGAGILFVVFVSAVVGVGLWVIAPKAGSQAMGYIARTAVGAIVLLNLALLITWYQGF